jgi:hypothetical protein
VNAHRLVFSALAAVLGVLAFASAPALAAPLEAPELTVESITAASASLHGVLNPKTESEAGTYEFLYKQGKAGCAGGTKVPVPAGLMTGIREEPSEVISGLSAHTEYTACLHAVNTTSMPVEEKTSPAVTFTTALPPETPQTVAPEPQSVSGTAATLKGVLNPGAAREFEPGSYEFRYRQSASECQGGAAGEEQATPKTTALGHEKEAVSAAVSGLLPGMAYTFCVLARNAAEETAIGGPVTFTTPSVAPAVESESVTNVAATSATLDAQIDPGGTESTYHFEYGTTTLYDQSTVESGLGGMGDSGQLAEAHLQGLQADTVYHYRVVASNAHSPGGTPGPDETFTTQRVGGEMKLPDGRVWELVSPAQSEGAAMIYFIEYPLQAAADGSAITYDASKPIEPGTQGNANGNRIFSWRAPSGWSSREIDVPTESTSNPRVGTGENYRFFSSNLAYSIVEPTGKELDRLLSSEATERTPFLRSDYSNASMTEACVSDCYRPLVTAANVPPGTEFGDEPKPGEEFGLSFLPSGPLRVEAVSPDLKSVLLYVPEEVGYEAALTQPASPSKQYVWTAGRIEPLPGGFLAITDGRVFFAEGSGIGVLDVGSGESRVIAQEAAFVSVNSDGSRVFFTKESHLFQFDVEDGQVTSVMPGKDVQVGGVVGQSEDGAYLYFYGSVDGSEGAYVLHESSPEWTVRLVPGLSEASSSPIVGTTQIKREAPVLSPDGRYLAFRSVSSLTGYDNHPADPEDCGQPPEQLGGEFGPEPCGEVYLYSADSGKLACVSCNPTGETPSGESYLEGPSFNGLVDGLKGPPVHQPRDVSDSGKVFFNSSDALVPEDVDGTQDVYEYEPVGAGSCTTADSTFSEGSGGCVSLLSAGTSPQESKFLDASETGGDVFLLTTAKLSSQDPGEAWVVYDAHECTGAVPCHVAVVGSPPCSTEASCRPAPTPQPASYGAPSSATFSGAGDIAPVAPASVKGKARLTRTQKLAKALKACAKRSKKKRAVCEKQARRAYGPVGKIKKSRKGGK